MTGPNPIKRFLPTALTVIGALVLIALLVAAAGADPFEAFRVFFAGSLGRMAGIYEVVVRAIPLAIIGLGIVYAFRARIFNVGADGQLIVGAVAAVAASQALPDLSGWLLIPIYLLVGMLGGALYGGLAGWLRARYNANEIIVTIMLNYVALQFLSWVIRGPMQESMGVFPRSDPIPEAIVFEPIIASSRIHGGLLIALLATLATYVVFSRSRFGFQIDAVGESRPAARYGGANDAFIIVASMLASGALAGLAGAVEIAGIHERLQDGFASGFGITAIAVALMARLRPLAVPFTAALFGLLSVGSAVLQRELGVPFPLVSVIEGIVILGFLVTSYLRSRQREARAYG